LSVDPECAKIISSCRAFSGSGIKSIFIQSQLGGNFQLLRLIRNLAQSHPGSVAGFDEEIVQAFFANKKRMDAMAEIMAIASRLKMTPDRAKFFSQFPGLLSLIYGLLRGQFHQQFRLESVVFLSSILLLCEQVPQVDLVKMIADILSGNRNDPDIQGQCLFALSRLIYVPQLRDQVFKPAMLEGILELSSSKVVAVRTIANLILDAGATFSPKIRNCLKGPRFDRFNRDWLVVAERGLNS
jgi:hypothetical protein